MVAQQGELLLVEELFGSDDPHGWFWKVDQILQRLLRPGNVPPKLLPGSTLAWSLNHWHLPDSELDGLLVVFIWLVLREDGLTVAPSFNTLTAPLGRRILKVLLLLIRENQAHA